MGSPEQTQVFPYSTSSFAERFYDTKRLCVFDLDNTLATANPTPEERRARAELVEAVKASGVPFVFSSARPPELMMSERAYLASRRNGFDRPLPHRGARRSDGSRRYVPLETLPEFENLLDPDAIIGFGAGIYVHAHDRGGYFADEAFGAKFAGRNWRGRTLDMLEQISIGGDLARALSPLEFETGFAEGTMDVFPLPNRIQLEFKGAGAARRLTDAKFRISGLANSGVEIVDESRPAAGHYLAYLVPPGASKRGSLEWLIGRLCLATGAREEELSLFVAGDAMTDVETCSVAASARFTFVLAGRSPLGPCFTRGAESAFAGDQFRQMKELLRPTDRDGVYRFERADERARTFVVSDHAAEYASPPASVMPHFREWLEAA
jgi:hypothetical protein